MTVETESGKRCMEVFNEIINSHTFNCRYIFSLALADLLVIIICVPLASMVYTLESWPWGSALCRITECAKDISIGVSVFTLTALSAERYCAIVNPLRKLQVKRTIIYNIIIRAHTAQQMYELNTKQQDRKCFSQSLPRM